MKKKCKISRTVVEIAIVDFDDKGDCGEYEVIDEIEVMDFEIIKELE